MPAGPAIAVFGAGRMGALHARTVAESGLATLAGVADVDTGAAQRLASSLGTGKAAAVDVFLNDPAVAAVVIATSSDTHADLILRSARAGKHIFCEKPISLDVDTTEQAIRACEDAGVLLQIGFQRRFDADFLAVREAIESGEVGEVRFLRLVSRDRTLPPLSYIPTSGGQFRDQMIHDFDAARWLLAPADVVEVTAAGSAVVAPEIGEMGDVDTAVAILRFSNGAVAMMDVSREAAYGYDVRIEVHGSNGMLMTGSENMTNGRLLDSGFATPKTDSFLTRFSEAYEREIAEFAQVVAGKGRPRAGGRDALAALKIALAADRSRESACTVKLAETVTR